jgi:hypothetical protein
MTRKNARQNEPRHHGDDDKTGAVVDNLSHDQGGAVIAGLDRLRFSFGSLSPNFSIHCDMSPALLLAGSVAVKLPRTGRELRHRQGTAP